MAWTSSIKFMTILSFDLDLQPTRTYVSNDTFTPWEQQLCQIILKSMHKCFSYIQILTDTQHKHEQCMYIHRTEIVTTMSRSPQAGWTKSAPHECPILSYKDLQMYEVFCSVKLNHYQYQHEATSLYHDMYLKVSD